MRLVFSLASLSCALACTIENPTFTLTDPSAGSTGRATEGDATSASTTTDPAPTTSPEPTTDTVTGTTGANGVTSDTPPDTTTEEPATTDNLGTTDPVGSTGTTGEPEACQELGLSEPRLVQLVSLPGNIPIPSNVCNTGDGIEHAGRLFVYETVNSAGRFSIKPDGGCGGPMLPGIVEFHLEWPIEQDQVRYGNGECVKVVYTAHDDDAEAPCAVSSFKITYNGPNEADKGKVILAGGFGLDSACEFPVDNISSFAIAPKPTESCACDGSGPFDLMYQYDGEAMNIPESPNMLFPLSPADGLDYNVVHFRSHVVPVCNVEPTPPTYEWHHVDWVAALAP